MPAFTKVSASKAAKWTDPKPCSKRKMTRKEYAACVESNVARFDRAIDQKG